MRFSIGRGLEQRAQRLEKVEAFPLKETYVSMMSVYIEALRLWPIAYSTGAVKTLPVETLLHLNWDIAQAASHSLQSIVYDCKTALDRIAPLKMFFTLIEKYALSDVTATNTLVTQLSVMLRQWGEREKKDRAGSSSETPSGRRNVGALLHERRKVKKNTIL